MTDRWPTSRVTLAAVALLAGFALAGDVAPPAPHPEIEQWITQLASDDWNVRQRAGEKLVEIGEEALPRLTKLAGASDDGEVRTRAATAIAQIEQNRIVGKSLITMKLDHAPAAEAFAELARQARAPIATDPANLLSQKSLKPVSLNVDRRPFWEVVQSLCAQTDLEVTELTRHNREIGLGLTRGNAEWMDKPIVLSGPLLIRADRLVRINTARLRQPRDSSEEFNVSLTVFSEPKLRVLDYSGTIRLEEVVDEGGHSLIPPGDNAAVAANADAFGNTREGNTSRWEIGATLHHPKGMGTRIVRLKASTVLQVQTRSAVLELPIAGAKNVSRTVGGLRVQVKNLDATRCDLSVYRDGRNDAEWYGVRMQLYAGEARLLDDKGQVVGRNQNGMDADETPDSQRLEFRIRFTRERDGGDESREGKKKNISEASKLQWEFPLESRELVVPFEFHDLPIP